MLLEQRTTDNAVHGEREVVIKAAGALCNCLLRV